MTEAITSLDGQILLFIQEHIRCGFLDVIMKAASWLGDNGLVWIIAAVLLLIFPKTRRGGLDTALCLAAASALNNLGIKNIVARARPYTVIEGLEILVEPLSSFSFPSGHSCSSFAAAFAIAMAFRGKGGGWAFLPACIIALSRLYVGVHYPTDVLCGAALGVLVAWGVYALSRRFIKGDLITQRERSKMS